MENLEKSLFIDHISKLDTGIIRNPYKIFGYSVRFAEDSHAFHGKRWINGVELFSSDETLFLYSEKKNLITMVDLIHFILIATSFKNNCFQESDRLGILKQLLARDSDEYGFSFYSEESVDYLEMQHTLIYLVTGRFEDTYYKNIMLNTKKNSVFDGL